MDIKNINEICREVDLAYPIDKNIKSWSKIENRETNEGLKKFGIEYIRQAIEGSFEACVEKYCDEKYPVNKKARDKMISKMLSSLKGCDYFFEYSIWPSVLSPRNPNQLACFSYLKGHQAFRKIFTPMHGELVSAYERNIVAFKDENHVNIFQHPNFLFDVLTQDEENSLTVVTHALSNKATSSTSSSDSDSPSEMMKVMMMSRGYVETIDESRKYYNSDSFEPLSNIQQKLHQRFVDSTGITTSYYISFPIIGARASNKIDRLSVCKDETSAAPIQAIGTFFLFIDTTSLGGKKHFEMFELFKQSAELMYTKIGDLIRLYSANYILNLGFQLQEKARQEAVKSAKAAIMSRNMSHNLGSHVMAYLKNDLRSVPAIFESDVLSKLYPESIQGLSQASLKEVEMPFLIGLGAFIGYLQERQDYIATIASSYIPSFSPVNFKDAVYDELNPDLRFERHHLNDRENHNRPQNILLSYIAKSEKLSRIKNESAVNHDILLGFKPGANKEIFGLTSASNRSDHDSLGPMRQINFALPGGIVGRQALFSIIENIIRNAAKHNNVEGDLALIFEVLDGEAFVSSSDVYTQSIDSKCIREQYHHSTDISDLLILSITDNQVCKNSTVWKLRTALTQGYLGENAHLNKGIKEIKISSTWLRGTENEDLFAPCPIDESSNIVYDKMAPIVTIEKTREGHLRYLICVRKTYEVALVHDDYVEEERDRKQQKIDSFANSFDLKKGSFIVISASEIIHSDTCFEYIVTENQAVLDRIRPSVSNRCVCKTVFENQSGITAEMIYQAYTGIGANSPSIFIEDTKTPIDNIIFKDKIKIVDSFKTASEEGAHYMYRSHHFGEKEFIAYWNDRTDMQGQKHCIISADKPVDISIDAITGDNSSDRLVRREILDKKWYYGHLYALKSDVAIFDERLFQIVHGLDESQIVEGSFLASEMLRQIDFPDWHQNLTRREIRDLAYSIGVKDDDDLALFINLYSTANHSGLKEFLPRYCFRLKESIIGKNPLTAAYREKRMEIYTIIPTAADACLIVGCSDYEYKTVNPDNPVFSFPFKVVATIRKENGEYHCSAIKKCHYMTIHQGLIDKMYTEFNIAEDDEAEKLKLIHALYNALLDDSKTAKTEAFLPRLIIHSGRGHITKKDMPMNLPFLQYSAIEHAVLDCKYSLVELLDFARFN